MSDDTERSVASTGSGAKCRPIGAYVHSPTYDDLLAEIERLRITDAERKAIEKLLRLLREDYFAGRSYQSVELAAVIDGLLDRIG